MPRSVIRQARRPGGPASMPKTVLLFAVPAIVLYAFVLLVPTVRGSLYAFTDWDGLSQVFDFVGLRNFESIFANPDAVKAVINTVIIAFVTTILANVIGLALALALNSRIKSRNVLRVFFFAPAVLTPVVTAFLFKYIFAPLGPLNGLLDFVGLPMLKQDWLGDANWALVAIMVVIVWQQSGYAMVIYLAGLQGVPVELLEAGAVDGAGPIRRFWSITRPLLAPAITISVMLILIHGLKVFAEVWIMTGGGPGNATNSLSTLIYKNAFQFGLFGSSIAMALVLLVMVAAISAVQYRALLSQGGSK
ncbi:MAG: sugar ABC transporter permease [Rhodoglobus sp.]|nr:sugar ABC transporter permease [Rhodoglobus sp.]